MKTMSEDVIILRESWECRECKELAMELGEEANCDICQPKRGKLLSFVKGWFKTYGIVQIGSKLHKIPIDRIRLPKGD